MKTGKLILEGTNNCEDFEWDDLNYCINKNKFKTEHFLCKVESFGWRGLDGHKYCKAKDLTSLLSSILPDTDCRFKIHNFGKGIAIQNFHHDSCIGNEWYYCNPIAESTYLKKV